MPQFQTLLLSKENVAKHNYKLPADASLSLHCGEYIDNMNIPISPIEDFLSGELFLAGKDDKSFLETCRNPFFLQQSLPYYQKALSLHELRAHIDLSVEITPIVKGRRKYRKYPKNKTKRIEYESELCSQEQNQKPKKEKIEMILQERYLHDPDRGWNNQYHIIGYDRTPSPPTIGSGLGLHQREITSVSANHSPLTPVNLKQTSLFDAVPLLLQGP
jgi:hypothetical protein